MPIQPIEVTVVLASVADATNEVLRHVLQRIIVGMVATPILLFAFRHMFVTNLVAAPNSLRKVDNSW